MRNSSELHSRSDIDIEFSFICLALYFASLSFQVVSCQAPQFSSKREEIFWRVLCACHASRVGSLHRNIIYKYARKDGILILYEKLKVGQRPDGTIVVGTDPRGNLNTGKKLSNREVLPSILLNKW